MVNNCICKGNWRLIVKESEPLLDKIYICSMGWEWIFFGIIHGSDDYYYGMWSKELQKLRQLSCVGSIDSHGYKLK